MSNLAMFLTVVYFLGVGYHHHGITTELRVRGEPMPWAELRLYSIAAYALIVFGWPVIFLLWIVVRSARITLRR